MNRIFKSTLKWVIILIFDFIVFMFLGLLLMSYDDFYEESKGEYGSFKSMTLFQKTVEIGFSIWCTLNFLFLSGIVYKKWRNNKKLKNEDEK